MPTDAALEQYLSKLDKALGQIPVSDRADIITEIKSHILESVERNPEQKLGHVLSSLGEPESVANRYLLERGLKPGKAPKSPIIKWLTIGFLGSLGIFLVFVMFLVWRFSPIIKVDEENDRVTILGGMIDISGETGSIKFGNEGFEAGFQTHEGDVNFVGSKLKEIQLGFMNGKFDVATSKDQTLKWRCKSNNYKGADFALEEGNTIKLNAGGAHNIKCELEIPAGIRLIGEGTNGKFKIVNPNFPIDLKITNGTVVMKPDENKNYKFDTNVINGKIDGLQSSPAPDAILVKLTMTNGKISGK